MSVHGITNEFLADKPRFADIARDLWEWIGGDELIIHNAPFDVGFLDLANGLQPWSERRLVAFFNAHV